jgi:hypothetical protein
LEDIDAPEAQPPQRCRGPLDQGQR